MTNNLVSPPLSLLNKQMDPVSNELEVSIPNMRTGMMGSMSISPTLQQFEISNKRMEPVSNNLVLQNSAVLNKEIGQMPQVRDSGLQQFFVPNQQVGHMQAMLNNPGSPKISFPSKRNAAGEPMVTDSVAQHLMPNKNVAHVGPFISTPALQQFSAPNRKPIQVHSKYSTPVSQNLPAPTKKMVRNESISGRSGTKQLATPKNRSMQMETSSKVQTESFESVRSKMRESLASALALVTQQQEKASNEENNSDNKAAVTPRRTQQDSQHADSNALPADADRVSGNPTDCSALKESCPDYKADDDHNTSQGVLALESMGDSAQTWKGDGHLIQCNSVLPSEDAPFGDSYPVKDELLQGNGLAWACDLVVDVDEMKEIRIAKKPKLVNEVVDGDVGEKAVQSPKRLAFKIEVELFKLFGGVNKKYRERGRSLLFNLKDRSNPELRERVMSGEITPERLCSMTAEELASKELSQWRIAKAEELAQMVVLPDSDVDIRRLVRKTHKGEFQVEVEQDDGVSLEVSVGTSSLIRLQPKSEDTEVPSAKADEIKDKENVVGEKSSSENQDLSCSITIPNDGTDLMQGLMVDEFKDAEFLTPIVSLDEFMESLDSEPPFENLPVHGAKTISPSDKESSDLGAKDPVRAITEKSDTLDVKYKGSDVKTKSTESPTEPKSSPPVAVSGDDHFWEGVLQLNISAMVTVVGFFKSGEKTSTKEWLTPLDIKGRVRLDAFEKFLQELPMSRSRAVMVVQFVLKEGSSEDDCANLTEAVHSYVTDERLGIAEPAPGVEIYFCPPHPKVVEMLNKHLPRDHSEILNSIDSGLIGIIVWRKPHLTSKISPNSSHHHKHGLKRQHFTHGRQQERNLNTNVSFACKPTLPFGTVPKTDDEDDDVPPGFGPLDEDDLPEFNFTGHPNRSLPKRFNRAPSMASPRPVDQMRKLVQRYGQSGNNIARTNQPSWNEDEDDDDNDIPEWQPQAPPQLQLPPPQQPPPVPNFSHPMPPLAMNQQHPGVAMPWLQMVAPPPVNMAQGGLLVGPQQGGGWWGQLPGHGGLQPHSLGSQPSNGQYYGVPVAGQPGIDYRQDADPRNGGF